MEIDSNFLQQFKNSILNYYKNINIKPVLPDIAEILLTALHEQFLTQGKYFYSSTWASLAPSTIKSRKKKGYWPGSILQQTGGLASSINYAITSNGIFVGLSKEYAGYLHFGTSKMPARPILPLQLPQETIEEISYAIIHILKE